MKRTLGSILFLLCLTLPLAVQAGELREIVLNDGSVIVGEVVSLANGVYTVKTATLGDLKVEDSKIKAIRDIAGSMAGPEKALGQKEITSIRKGMMADGSIIQQILSLQNDPDFQEILLDDSIMKSITSGDYNALMTNPKILKLMEKSTVQDIKRKLE